MTDRESPPAWCRACGAQRPATRIRERDCDLCRVIGPGYVAGLLADGETVRASMRDEAAPLAPTDADMQRRLT